MAEDTDRDDAGAPEAPETGPENGPEKGGEVDWKREARKWERRAKENGDAAARVTGRAEAAEGALAEREAEIAALRAAAERREWAEAAAEQTGVPARVLARVEADGAEDMLAVARELASARGAVLPVVDGDGVHPEAVRPPEDGNAWLRRIAGYH
ncbi:hypothetical protein AAK967_02235 [Atopobiaceae bacterium 24-176]